MNVKSHFAKSDEPVFATYQRILETARALGPVIEEPKPATWLTGAYELAG